MVRVVVYSFVGMLLLIAGTAQAVDMVTVAVGNPGNANDTHGGGYGGVDTEYRIGKYEITAGQYLDFLNAVAADDTYGLYNPSMDSDPYGCQITQNGTSGSYTYDFSGGTVEVPGSTAADWENRPVNYVSWGDAARFANWLHNGQPMGAQDLTTTEDGSYYLNGATDDPALLAVVREQDATWVIPTEDEWYKAAYYDGGGSVYYNYPTSSDSVPNNDLVEPTDPGNNATFYDGSWPDPAGYTIGDPYYRTEAGAHENSDSPYGTYDQGGNVWEWCEAVRDSSYRGLRGGPFNGGDINLRAADRDHYNFPAYESYHVGFRVAEVFVGACPFPDGHCEDLSEEACELAGGKYLGDGTTCLTAIPAVSEWGLLVMALLGLVAGTVMFRGRRAVAA